MIKKVLVKDAVIYALNTMTNYGVLYSNCLNFNVVELKKDGIKISRFHSLKDYSNYLINIAIHSYNNERCNYTRPFTKTFKTAYTYIYYL